MTSLTIAPESFQLGHTEMSLPYISDTGAYPPESCIFAQFLNLGALLIGVDVYIRYKQVFNILGVMFHCGLSAIHLNYYKYITLSILFF